MESWVGFFPLGVAAIMLVAIVKRVIKGKKTDESAV